MNQLKATIIKIETIESLNLLTLSCGEQTIEILTLELNPNLRVGSSVKLSVKSTVEVPFVLSTTQYSS
jgi:hypothetical protein